MFKGACRPKVAQASTCDVPLDLGQQIRDLPQNFFGLLSPKMLFSLTLQTLRRWTLL